MNAIRQLYRNTGLVTEDGYIKVNDKLWVTSGPYERKPIKNLKRKDLPTEEEALEILLNIDKIASVQCNCRFTGRIDCLTTFWINHGLRRKVCYIFDLRSGSSRTRFIANFGHIVKVRRTKS